MRLREIKPGMVVKCKKDEELKILLEEAEKLGYLWAGGRKPTEEINAGRTIHFYDKSECEEYKHITWSDDKGNTEFSDLIIPELSAEEVLRICNVLCDGTECEECLMRDNCFREFKTDFKKVVEICEKWKVDHEKKEPEVEWVNLCKILEVQGVIKKRVQEEEITGLDGTDLYSAVEDKAQEILKKYISEHGGNYIAVVERVCRVKKGD